MRKLEEEIIEKFTKKFVRDDGLMDKYGFLKNGEQCYLARAIEEFIRQELLSYRREIEKTVVEAVGEMEKPVDDWSGRDSVRAIRNGLRQQILDKLKLINNEK